jgi:hypothetical protein
MFFNGRLAPANQYARSGQRGAGQRGSAAHDLQIRPPEINLAEHRIRRKQVLGGLTHEYQIAA